MKDYKKQKIHLESNRFHEIKTTIKESIFYLFHILLKLPGHGLWLDVIFIIIEMVQFLGFSFSLIFCSVWKNINAFKKISYFFQYFHVVSFLIDNEVIYISTFYACTISIILTMIWAISITVLLFKKFIIPKWMLILMKNVLTSLSTVAFFPLFQISISMFKCVNSKDIIRTQYTKTPFTVTTNKKVNYYNPTLACYGAVYNVNLALSGIISILIIIIFYVVITIHYDFKSLNNLSISGRINSKFDKTKYLAKIILCLSFCFLGIKSNDWILLCLLCALSLILLYTYMTTKPYFNKVISFLSFISMAIFSWSTIVLLIGKILENHPFDGCLPLFAIGIPVIIAAILYYDENMFKLLIINIVSFRTGAHAHSQIRFLLYLIQDKDTSRKSNIILKGYLNQFKTNSGVNSCSIRNYLKCLEKDNEPISLLLQHIDSLFQSTLNRYPDCIQLKIDYSFFLLDFMNKKQKAIKLLYLTKNDSPSFEEEFIIFRLKKQIEENKLDLSNDNIDYVSFVTYKYYFNEFKQILHKIALLYNDFWTLLLTHSKEQSHLETLNDYGTKIISSIDEMQVVFNKMQKIKTRDHELLYYYSDFYTYILNDEEKALLYKNQRQEVDQKKNIDEDKDKWFDLNSNLLNTTDEYQYIILSGKEENFRTIINISLGVCSLLGYTKNELIGQKIEQLMPEIFHKAHSTLLMSKFNEYKKEMDVHHNKKLNIKEIQTFARTKARYLIPFKLKSSIIYSESEGILFLSQVHPDTFTSSLSNGNISYILTNNQFIIQNFTVNAITLLEITSYYLNNSVEITAYISQFHQEFLKIAIERDNITPEDKLAIKNQIAHTRYSTQSPIYWRGNELLCESNYKSNKCILPNVNYNCNDLQKDKSIKGNNFYLSIQDANIGGKHEGYIFKFQSINAPSSSIYRQTLNTELQDNNKAMSSFNEQLKNTLAKDIKNEANLDQSKTKIPEDKSQFHFDLNNMAFVFSSDNNKVLKENIKNKALKKIYIDILKTMKTSKKETNEKEDEDSSSSVSGDDSYHNSSSDESNDTFIDEPKFISKSIRESSRRIGFTKKATLIENFHKVNTENIKYMIYNFEKETAVEIEIKDKRSQIEMKMFENNETEEEDKLQTKTDKSKKTLTLFKKDDINETNANSDLLIQQIKYALNKDEIQPTILRLKIVVILFAFFFISFGIAWLGLLCKSKQKITTNFFLINYSYQLSINLIISQAFIRDLTLITHANYTSRRNKTIVVNETISMLLELYNENYKIINKLITTSLELTGKEQMILNNMTFIIRVSQETFSYYQFNMTLSTALTLLNVACFHIVHDLQTYYPTNSNIYFYIFNVDNSIIISLKKLSSCYVEEFNEVIKYIKMTFIILVTVGFVISISTYYLFIYSYKEVAKRKESYLEIFFEIRNDFIKKSLIKCENYIHRIQATNLNEYLSYEENDEECFISNLNKVNQDKEQNIKSDKNSKEILMVKIIYCSLIIFILIYQSISFAEYLTFLDQLVLYVKITQSQNEVIQEYNQLFRNTREYLFDENMIVDFEPISSFFPYYLSHYYENSKSDQKDFIQYSSNFPSNFSLLYTKIYYSPLCPILKVTPKSCGTGLIKDVSEYGLGSLLSLFIEEIRFFKNYKYVNDKNIAPFGFKYNLTYTGTNRYDLLFPSDPSKYDIYFANSPIQLFNTNVYKRIRDIYQDFIKPLFFMQFTQLINDIQNFIEMIYIIFYCSNGLFIFIVICIYLFLWNPFETSLKTIIFKTKKMLAIIPKEVLASLGNIEILLNIDSVFSKIISPEKLND